MGTRTWGNTTMPASNTSFRYDIGDAMYRADNLVTATEEGYVDRIWCYCGAHNGGSSNFTLALYNGTNGLLGSTPTVAYGTGYGKNGISFPAGSFLHFLNGQTFVGAVLGTGQGLQTVGLSDGGSFHYTGTSSVPNPWPNSASQQTGLGNLPWYVEYFPVATITAITSTPVSVGANFVIQGRSYTAGVNSIVINGSTNVNVTSWTVDSDGQITAVVPVGASSGTVTVNTNAGSATSSSTLYLSGAHYKTGGVVYTTKGQWYKMSGQLNTLKGGWYKNGGTLNPLK